MCNLLTTNREQEEIIRIFVTNNPDFDIRDSYSQEVFGSLYDKIIYLQNLQKEVENDCKSKDLYEDILIEMSIELHKVLSHIINYYTFYRIKPNKRHKLREKKVKEALVNYMEFLREKTKSGDVVSWGDVMNDEYKSIKNLKEKVKPLLV